MALTGLVQVLPPGKVIFDQFPNITWHGNKYIRVGPDERLYIDLGAPCNDCKLDNAVGNVSFGSINSMRLDGSDLQPFASGACRLHHVCSAVENMTLPWQKSGQLI